LFIEDQRTNSIINSVDFSNDSWTKTNTTIVPNTIMSPDGSTTASKLTETAITGIHELRASAAATSTNNNIVLSIFVKAAERNFVYLRSDGNSKRMAIVVDLTNGNFNVTNWFATSNTIGTVTPFPNGWYNITITSQSNYPTAPGWAGNFYVAPIDSYQSATNVADSGFSYTGISGNGVYIWGAQYEIGGVHTSYIPTTGVAVTRVVDDARITGTNFSNWYNNANSTFYASGIANKTGNSRILTFNDSTSGVIFVNGNGGVSTRGLSGPATTSNLYGWGPFALIPLNSIYKAAATITSGMNGTYSLNGQNTATSSSLPNISTYSGVNILQISPPAGGGNKGNIISRIIYWNTRLPNTTLTNITK
jgi:hypothetical protein